MKLEKSEEDIDSGPIEEYKSFKSNPRVANLMIDDPGPTRGSVSLVKGVELLYLLKEL